jgi:hypothetical protein
LTLPVQVALPTSPFLYRATKEQEERILLAIERFNKIANERGHRAADEEAFAAFNFVNTLYVCILFT